MDSTHPSESRIRTVVARRVIGALAGLALAGGLAAGPALAASAATRPVTVRPASDVEEPDSVTPAAAAFAAGLDDAQLAVLADGIPHVPGTGLRFAALDPVQQAAAFALLRSLLSPDGWTQLAHLIETDADLGGLGDYRLALFGEPSADFVLQLSTGDLVLSIVRQGDEVDVRPDLVAG